MKSSTLAASPIIVLMLASLTQGQIRVDPVANLKQEIVELRAEVILLRRDVERLKKLSAPVRKPNLAARLTAIDGLTDFSEKQASYAKLAIEAGFHGDAKLATDCLPKITDFTARANTTYKVALSLAALGREDEAVKLAGMIPDFSMRQKLLAKIAKGETTP